MTNSNQSFKAQGKQGGEKLPEWARKLHDESCSWKSSCVDSQIVVAPKCRECGDSDPESVAHKGENILCPKCWNKALREAIY